MLGYTIKILQKNKYDNINVGIFWYDSCILIEIFEK